MKSRSRKLFHGAIVVIGLASISSVPRRVRAASAIARDDDDDNERSTDNYARTAGVGFSRRADRVISGPTSGANARRFDLPTGSNSASTVDEQQ